MLENMRRQGASIFVYLIFCLLIAIFVINFGPQGGNKGGGCRGENNLIMGVDGSELTQTAYHIAYANSYNRGQGKQRTYWALEMLIRRELLADAADGRGLVATDDMVDDQIKKGRFFIGGQRATIPGAVDTDDDGQTWFSRKAVHAWVGQLNVSMNSYREEQKRSLLANMMADVLQESVQVSKDEALARFLYENNTVTYDVVTFKPEVYRAVLKASDADVDKWLAAHEDEVKARYKADERTYKAVKPQLKVREIFIAKLEPEAAKPAEDKAAPADDKKADDKKADDKKADKAGAKAKPVGMPIEEAKAKLEAARAAIAAGKQKLADAASQLSTDEAMKSTGGDMGWRSADNAMLGEKAVNDAVKALKPGELTPVITTDRGVYLVQVEDKREGDLGYDQVKHEIAKELARDAWAKEAARRAAVAALEGAHNSVGLNLDQLYERELVPEGPSQMDLQKILNDPNMSDEEKQQLLQMLLKSQKHGSTITVEGKDQPAAWYADADTKGGGSGSATTVPAAGSGAGAATGAGAGAAAGAGSAAGSGAASGSGSGAGSAAPAAPAAPPVDLMAPSKEPLPPMGDVAKAKVNRFGPAPRSSKMPGLGSSKDAADAVFDELQPGGPERGLAKRIYEAEGNYIVLQVIARSQPQIADFEKDAAQRVSELRQSRAQSFLEDWMREKCEKLAKDGKIRPNPELISERDDQGKPMPVQYRPCMSFH